MSKGNILMQRNFIPLRLISLLLFMWAVFIGTGCGSDDTKKVDCSDVVCEFGVCDDTSGQCANPSTCNESSSCLPGYECSAGTCIAEFSCRDSGDCFRGVCSDGACVNKATCDVLDECLDGFFCSDDNTCRVNRCLNTSCERGTCESLTGDCINRATCEQEFETEACIEGFYCHENSCTSEEDLCTMLGCDEQRGACLAADRECGNAPDCMGDDNLCLEGYFCDENDTCQQNICDADGIECQRGICDRASGTCVNKETCTATSDCVDAHFCVEEQCLSTEEACAPCTGNQTCDFNTSTGSVLCEESDDGCQNALDCSGDRVCSGYQCEEPYACVPDSFENNDRDNPIDLNELLEVTPVQANICPQDTDIFRYDTRELGISQGILIVDVRYDHQDIGLGTLHVDLESSQGDILATAHDNDSGNISLEYEIDENSHDDFLIVVSDQGNIKASGIRYRVSAELISNHAALSCNNAVNLEEGVLSANSRLGDIFSSGSTCTSPNNSSSKNIYRIEIDQQSYIELQATPVADSGTAISMSLRESCLTLFSEIACANDGGVHEEESIAMILNPGVYYLFVQGPNSMSGGTYELSYSVTPTICRPGSSYCADDRTTAICNDLGTEYENRHCDNNCDDSTGFCTRMPGDLCHQAIDASNGYSGGIDWSLYNSDYNPGSDSCVPNNNDDAFTNGNESIFYVELQPGHVVLADLTSHFNYTSLYIVSRCSDVGASCLAGSNTGELNPTGQVLERVTYENTTDEPMELYIIADSNENQAFGVAGIDISIGVRVCTPNAGRCQGDIREVCTPLGSEYVVERTCPFGCDDASGQCFDAPNDECKGAVDIVAEGGSFTSLIDDYISSYELGLSSCVGRNTPGKDAAFVVNANAGDIITADIEATFDAALWVMTDCTRPDGTCIQGADNQSAGSVEQLQFAAPYSGRFFIIVDSYQANNQGTFTINVDVSEPECVPGEALECQNDTDLIYCNSLGLPDTYTCDTTCSNGQCDQPIGDICADAIALTSGDTVNGDFSGSNSMSIGTGNLGQCSFGSSNQSGVDTVYAVDMESGERLTVDFTTDSSSALVYLVDSCHSQASCLGNTAQGGTQSLTYDADETQTVYIVVDRTVAETSSSSTYSLTVSTQESGCNLGPIACVNDTTLGFCNDESFYDTYPCDGGCTDSACDTPRGDICQDAIPLSSGDSHTGTWTQQNSINLGSGDVGQCRFGTDAAIGRDTIYSVAMQQGDVLHAELDTTAFSTMMYIVDDCVDTTGCLANTVGDSDELFYVADTSKTVFLVVDRSTSFTSDVDYTVSVTVAPPSCTPNTASCASDAKTLEICNQYGIAVDYECATTCNGNTCDDPSGDICFEAIPLGEGGTFTGNFNGTDTLNPGAGDIGNCYFASFGTPTGRDTIYQASLQEGQRLQVELQSQASWAILYVLGDCIDTQDCRASTLEGTDLSLTYVAEEDEDIYLVVDRGVSSASESEYEFTATIQTPGCTPGEVQCINDTTIGLCSESGFFDTYPCEGNCTNNQCDDPQGDICIDAISLQSGQSHTGNWEGTDTINPGSGDVNSCAFGANDAPGRDTIYSIDLLAGQVLTANLDTSTSSAMMYLMNGCNEAASCLVAAPGTGAATLHYQASENETVFLVVDRTFAATVSTDYTVSIDIQSQNCTPGAIQCSNDGESLQICSSYSVWTTQPCDNGCSEGQCIDPTGDSCFEAIAIQSGDSVSGEFAGTDSINPGSGTVGQCSFSNFAAPGPDTVYSVELEQNEVLQANLTSTDSWSFMYILADCTAPTSCLAHNPTTGTSSIIYKADEAQTIYLVVDRDVASTSEETFTLDVSIQAPSCTPGEVQCSGDQSSLEICNNYGIFDSYECDGQCQSGQCENPVGDICQDAIILQPGESVEGGWLGSNTINPDAGISGACTLPADGAPGPDTIYAIEVPANNVLTAQLETNHDPAYLYIMDSCTTTQSCLASSDGYGESTVHYLSDTTKTVYLVVDRRYDDFAFAEYTLHVDVQPPTCTPGTRTCGSDGETLEICNEHGVADLYPCTDSCTGQKCDNPTGDVCYDAISLTSGQSFSGEFGDFTAQLDPGLNSCILNVSTARQAGRDAVFAVDLNEGDILEASLDTSDSLAGMYILTSCSLPASSACVHAAPRAKSLSFYADTTQTYYLIVDTASTFTTTAFSVAIDIDSSGAICQPNGTHCDATTNNLTICNNDGTATMATASCEFGCDRNYCAGPETVNNTCDNAMAINASTRILDSLDRYDNNYNMNSSSCIGRTTPGNDAVYRVSLTEGDVVRATVTEGNTVDDLVVYIVEGCTSVSSQCLNGNRAENHVAQAGYYADSDQDVFVVVDAEYSSDTGPFILDIEVAPSECEPGLAVCDSSERLKTCSGFGLFEYSTCHFGCDEGACMAPTNDTCEGAIDATDGIVFNAPISDYTNHYNTSDPGPTCTGFSSPGPEAVFYVDVEKNDIIYATHGGDYDTSLWITTDCAQASQQCVAGRDGGGTETVEYIAPESGRYYIMADSFSSSPSGSFTFTVDVLPPFCQSSEITCTDDNTLSICSDDGTEYIGFTCEGGCSNGACNSPQGDICADAINATGGGSYSGTFAALANTFDPGFNGCTGFDAPGSDAVYAVSVSAGDTVSATLSNSTGSTDISVYIVTNCQQAQSSCVAGSDTYGPGAETVSYTATDDGTIYVIADSYSANADTDYELVITVD